MILKDETRAKLLNDLKTGVFNMGNYPELSCKSTFDVSLLAPDEMEFLFGVISKINSHPDYTGFATVKIDRKLKVKILNTLLTGSINPDNFQEYAKQSEQTPDIGLTVDDFARLYDIYRKIEKKP